MVRLPLVSFPCLVGSCPVEGQVSRVCGRLCAFLCFCVCICLSSFVFAFMYVTYVYVCAAYLHMCSRKLEPRSRAWTRINIVCDPDDIDARMCVLLTCMCAAGNWVEDRVHGQGEHTYANGNRYSGDWVDGKITGYGVLSFADGETYEGELKDGRMQGRGTVSRKESLMGCFWLC